MLFHSRHALSRANHKHGIFYVCIPTYTLSIALQVYTRTHARSKRRILEYTMLNVNELTKMVRKKKNKWNKTSHKHNCPLATCSPFFSSLLTSALFYSEDFFFRFWQCCCRNSPTEGTCMYASVYRTIEEKQRRKQAPHSFILVVFWYFKFSFQGFSLRIDIIVCIQKSHY